MGYEKPSGTVTYIESCDFKNCSTKRESGKIIKEYFKYDTLFKKDIDFHANHVSECRGLDKVNKESAETETVEIRTVSTTGNSIGSALAMGVAGVVGGPVALATLVIAPDFYYDFTTFDGINLHRFAFVINKCSKSGGNNIK